MKKYLQLNFFIFIGLFQPTYNREYANNVFSSNFYPTLATPISGTCDCVGRSIEVEECRTTVSLSNPCAQVLPVNVINAAKYIKNNDNVQNDVLPSLHHPLFLDDRQSFNQYIPTRYQNKCIWQRWAEWSVCIGTCSKVYRFI